VIEFIVMFVMYTGAIATVWIGWFCLTCAILEILGFDVTMEKRKYG